MWPKRSPGLPSLALKPPPAPGSAASAPAPKPRRWDGADREAKSPGISEMKGSSPSNRKYIRKFAEVYKNETIVQEVLAQITWYHHITILDKVKEPTTMDF